jgi:RNA polymerase sigma-70 factor (sigma-E family)
MAQRFGQAMRALTGRDRDSEFTEYMRARLPWLRRLAFRLCQDWQRADDLVQAAIIDLYVQWGRAAAADHIDSYARTILVRKYLSERRSRWFRQVILPGGVPDGSGGEADHEMALDVRSAVAGLPAGQRAVLVLRYFYDLSVEQTARELGCSEGTVKSQTARAIAALRTTIGAGLLPGEEWR